MTMTKDEEEQAQACLVGCLFLPLILFWVFLEWASGDMDKQNKESLTMPSLSEFIFGNRKRRAVELLLGSIVFLAFALWVQNICRDNFWCRGAAFDYRYFLYMGIGVLVFAIVNLWSILRKGK